MVDRPCLITAAEAAEQHRIEDVGRRIRRWCRDGTLRVAGVYFPPGGRAPVELFNAEHVLALAEGRATA